MLRVTIDTKDFGKLSRDLKKYRETALPHAVRDALNGCAFELQRSWREEIGQSFVTRTPFTERSVLVDKAKGGSIRSMQAVTGSRAPYMGDQEEGAVIRGKGKHKAVPAAVAGGAAGPGVRPKVVLGRFRLGGIKVRDPKVGRFGRRQRNAIALETAARTGNRFALLSKGKGGRAIFEVRRVGRRQFKTRLIWNLDRGSVVVKPEPTMHRSADHNAGAFRKITERALLNQLKRNRVMGY